MVKRALSTSWRSCRISIRTTDKKSAFDNARGADTSHELDRRFLQEVQKIDAAAPMESRASGTVAEFTEF